MSNSENNDKEINRPIGITIIALVAFFGAFIGALSITFEFAGGVVNGFWNLIRTILNLIAGFGLWKMKKWAYPWVIVIYSFLLIGNAALFLSFQVGNPGNIFSSVLIFSIMIYYIYTKSELFKN